MLKKMINVATPKIVELYQSFCFFDSRLSKKQDNRVLAELFVAYRSGWLRKLFVNQNIGLVTFST
jgi:hypothetical protein